jgi:hypothetical protein
LQTESDPASEELARANAAIRAAASAAHATEQEYPPAEKVLAHGGGWLLLSSTDSTTGQSALYFTHAVNSMVVLALGPDSEPKVAEMTAAGVPVDMQAAATGMTAAEVKAEQAGLASPSPIASQLSVSTSLMPDPSGLVSNLADLAGLFRADHWQVTANGRREERSRMPPVLADGALIGWIRSMDR